MKVLSVASSYSDQPEQNVITISRIKDADCPYRYYKNYVETPKQPKPFETIELGIGQFFHSFVESKFKQVFARGHAINKNDKIDVKALLRSFRMSFLWEGKLRKLYRIVRHGHNIADFEHRLATIGSNFNSFLVRKLVGHEVVTVEGELQIRAEGCYIRGKYDLITKGPHGNLALWDWKTGRMPKPEYFKDFYTQKAQLGVYAIWMRYKYNTKNVRGYAVFLRDNLDLLSETFRPSVEKDVLEYMQYSRDELNEMNSYPAIPNNLCSWCSWNEVCDEEAGYTASSK